MGLRAKTLTFMVGIEFLVFLKCSHDKSKPGGCEEADEVITVDEIDAMLPGLMS